MSRLTSLVAVDVTPSRPINENLNSQDIPLNLPEGWDFDKVFGETYDEELPSIEDIYNKPSKALISTKPPQVALARTRNSSVHLPATATTADLNILAGIILLLVSILLLLLSRKLSFKYEPFA